MQGVSGFLGICAVLQIIGWGVATGTWALWGHSLVSHHWAEWDLTHWESLFGNVVVESGPLGLKEHLGGPILYGGSIQMQINNVEEALQTYKLYQT